MADIPVCMKCEGFSLATGFIGRPFMSSLISGMTGGAVYRFSDAVECPPSMSIERPSSQPLRSDIRWSLRSHPCGSFQHLDDRSSLHKLEDLAFLYLSAPEADIGHLPTPAPDPFKEERGPDIRLMVLYSLVTSFINKTSFSDSLCIPEPILKNLPRHFRLS